MKYAWREKNIPSFNLPLIILYELQFISNIVNISNVPVVDGFLKIDINYEISLLIYKISIQKKASLCSVS